MSTPNTIVLKGNGIRKERPAGGTITPGHLVMLNSSNQVVVHAVEGGSAPQRAFAVENEVVGKEIDDNYTTGENVLYEVLPPGAEVYALLPAGAEAIVIGDKLESAGDGTLQKHVPQDDTSGTPAASIRVGQIVAIALEAVDNSGGGTPVRIKVELL